MKQILIHFDKHGDQYYDASTNELKYSNSLKILRRNYSSGYYGPEDNEKLVDIMNEEDGKRAYQFLLSRTDHEYERIEIQKVE